MQGADAFEGVWGEALAGLPDGVAEFGEVCGFLDLPVFALGFGGWGGGALVAGGFVFLHFEEGGLFHFGFAGGFSLCFQGCEGFVGELFGLGCCCLAVRFR